MKRSLLVFSACLLDGITGDPEEMPHPVRAIGASIRVAERSMRRHGSGKVFDLVAGGIAALVITAASLLCGRAALRIAYRFPDICGPLFEAWLASACLAARNLLEEAAAVLYALEAGDLPLARQRVSRIVGRDTASLTETEISRAVIETLAESLSDGVIAPLFYLSLGGVPLALAYKAVNTLDSMIGHRDEQYLYFGRAAARLDDAANWIPARISASLLCLAASVCARSDSGRSALRLWLRDGDRHSSPNAGQVESAMAGALGVRLGGTNYYDGEEHASPCLGAEFPPPQKRDAARAMKLTAAACLLGFAGALLLTARRTRV
ncbi:adenosylcobinamide-phosphate synthase CbiB [Paracidobacterium acidisoli]|uniref:Cobalamin biosynthesis protein CobD n=1 Tax=Paracidobacterium acidisoli TaxID=2303751 RepID=A0A372IQW8_9BACT|nr:adenosylcobinamide-phosphate synthase CbiB [Paracidobacterium acidisoli]MBT9331247.1 adenosylcobinamide-phosphate synthase CbiB [Paracidobacterium acidisoli]